MAKVFTLKGWMERLGWGTVVVFFLGSVFGYLLRTPDESFGKCDETLFKSVVACEKIESECVRATYVLAREAQRVEQTAGKCSAHVCAHCPR
jgi:hypothetical protein